MRRTFNKILLYLNTISACHRDIIKLIWKNPRLAGIHHHIVAIFSISDYEIVWKELHKAEGIYMRKRHKYFVNYSTYPNIPLAMRMELIKKENKNYKLYRKMCQS